MDHKKKPLKRKKWDYDVAQLLAQNPVCLTFLEQRKTVKVLIPAPQAIRATKIRTPEPWCHLEAPKSTQQFL